MTDGDAQRRERQTGQTGRPAGRPSPGPQNAPYPGRGDAAASPCPTPVYGRRQRVPRGPPASEAKSKKYNTPRRGGTTRTTADRLSSIHMTCLADTSPLTS